MTIGRYEAGFFFEARAFVAASAAFFARALRAAGLMFSAARFPPLAPCSRKNSMISGFWLRYSETLGAGAFFATSVAYPSWTPSDQKWARESTIDTLGG